MVEVAGEPFVIVDCFVGEEVLKLLTSGDIGLWTSGRLENGLL